MRIWLYVWSRIRGRASHGVQGRETGVLVGIFTLASYGVLRGCIFGLLCGIPWAAKGGFGGLVEVPVPFFSKIYMAYTG